MPGVLQPGALPAQPQQGAGAPPLGSAQQQQAPQAPQQQAAPAPTHAQTVATLRHIDAMLKMYGGILKNPELGKSDVKSSIIDGVTKLVADRIVGPAPAVSQLANVPEKPIDQKKWIEQQYVQNVKAQSLVLDHHRTAALGTGNYELEDKLHDSDPDSHMEDVSGMLTKHYPGARNA